MFDDRDFDADRGESGELPRPGGCSPAERAGGEAAPVDPATGEAAPLTGTVSTGAPPPDSQSSGTLSSTNALSSETPPSETPPSDPLSEDPLSEDAQSTDAQSSETPPSDPLSEDAPPSNPPSEGLVAVGAERVWAILAGVGEAVEALGECEPAALVAALGALAPGPLAAAALAAVAEQELSGAEVIDLLRARARQVAHAEAGLAVTVAGVAERRLGAPQPAGGPGAAGAPGAPEEDVARFAADHIGAALCLSRTSARARLEDARDLTRRLPATLQTLAAGHIDAARARVLIEATRPLEDALCAAVETRVLARAPAQTARGLRESCKRAVLAADPGAAQARHDRAVADRTVVVFPREDGIAELVWTDRADRVLAFSVAVDALARAAKASADGRGVAQRRADVLTDLGARLLDLEGLPREHGARPQVSITVPLGTLLDVSHEPAELVGYGPIPPALAKSIAEDGVWRRLLTDPASGALLDVGRERYRPPAAIREHVLARDQYCQGLGCRVPARRCDIDHRIDWANGGHTRADDLDALCRHTHRLKHEGGWTRRREPDGATVWTTTTGHEYLRDPDWLPGAKPPAPITPHHHDAIREHARILGITLPTAGLTSPGRDHDHDQDHSRISVTDDPGSRPPGDSPPEHEEPDPPPF